MTTFAERFTELKIERKTTFRKIAETVGWSIGYWSDIGSGRKRPPSLDAVARLEKLLKVENGELILLANKERQKPTYAELEKRIEELEKQITASAEGE